MEGDPPLVRHLHRGPRPHRLAGVRRRRQDGRSASRTEPGAVGIAPVPWINHVRVPVVISALLLVMFFPLIFRLSNPYYQDATGFNESVYLFNWLAVSGALFIGSAVAYAIRLGLARRRAGR